jgi:hypothetical protein
MYTWRLGSSFSVIRADAGVIRAGSCTGQRLAVAARVQVEGDRMVLSIVVLLSCRIAQNPPRLVQRE